MGASLEQEAAVLARLGVTWYGDDGLPHSFPMGSYSPLGQYVHYDLNAEGVPNGSTVRSFHIYQFESPLRHFFFCLGVVLS